MALGPQPTGSQVIGAIRAPDTRREALHSLKHIILGHDEQKLEYVRAGLVDFLITILAEEPAFRHTRSKQPPDVETDIVIILGSLARGGSVFLNLHQIEQLVPALLNLLSSQSAYIPLLEATLRTLNCILSLPTATQSADMVNIVQNHHSTLYSISNVLNNTSSSRDFASYQATLLIPKICTPGDNRWQDAIVEAGILAALVRRVARVIKAVEITRAGKGSGILKMERPVADQNPLSKSPSAVSLRYQRRDMSKAFDRLPAAEHIPVPPASYITALLDAVVFTVRGSKFRSDEFLFASCITDILGEEAPLEAPRQAPSWRDAKSMDDSQGGSTSASGYSFTGQDFPPLSPSAERHAQTRAAPSGNSLHTATPYPPQEHSLDHERAKIPQISHLRFAGEKESDPESPLIQWLINYIRQEKVSSTRLAAISLLTDLVQTGCVSKRKVKRIGSSIVPMLIKYLDELDTPTVNYTKAYDMNFQAQEMEWAVREQAPAILATLLTDNQRLQAAAVEAGAIKRLAGTLKRTFDTLPKSSDGDGSILECHEMLWDEKVRAHHLKVREGTLRALAAIALFEDEHRKKIIDSGALAYVVGSLTPEPSSEIAEVDDIDTEMGEMHGQTHSQLANTAENNSVPQFTIPETSRTGNPVSVLVAATNVVRSLSRSVNVLSTSLIDWTVSEPLFKLLSHHSIQVQIAATAALCNLVVEFSPLRKGLEDKGIVKALGRLVRFGDGNVCAYNKEGIPIGEFDANKEALRLNSIWALKHLVLKQDEVIISNCLSSFGTAWLLEQVAIEDQPSKYSSDTGSLGNSSETRQLLGGHSIEFSDKVLDRLVSNYSPVRSEDQRKKALLEFQEQALDFFRNIMAGPTATSTFRQILRDTEDMVISSNMAVTREFPQSETLPILPANAMPPRFSTPFYDVLTEKLKSKPGEKIVLAIIYVLVHIGACAEHRARLIEQSSLFHELIKLFEMQVDQIRIGLSWLAINLTWKENGANGDFTRRVQKLREYRYVDKLEWLKSGGVGDSQDAGRRNGGGSGRGAAETVAVGIGEISTVRNSDGEVVRTGPTSINMSLDLRERCRQALAQINDQ
ncbi:hypothetical protein DRE_07484 [Drechslerella stenobrocha 248]|uniref:Armadillo repeat-containing protein 8 n=1 Tax=Drechslerella stenobrocha 248 TaxID=1043628 RepID=W7HTZ7_9PEZI|nr:hypothetical protein DRE_07484 [Drechslerella stenobrocha 248]